ncbi:MAG: DUF1080 domain-containing protein [Pirellulales bacterium]|nr:DUF1080 domain-containing protein [Pirellulales bacterium]
MLARHASFSALALILAASSLATSSSLAADKVKLFNGKDLSGWKTFIDPSKKNVKPEDIWSIEDGVIKCKGKPVGYLLSEDEYDNYILRFEWRWPDADGMGGNSGCFVHVVGEDKIWPKGVEAQLMADHAGDFWLVDGAQLTIDADRQDKGTPRHYYRTKDGVEKPRGEWNQYEITCDGDKITLVINGQEVNVGTNSELTKGRILLQSEGAPIEFRNIELEPLKK